MFTDFGPQADHMVTLRIDGEAHTVPAGITVAAALLSLGLSRFRHTPRDGSPRGAFCMMGVCFDCLCVIDGAPNRQACMTEVRDGMSIDVQTGAPEITGREPTP